MISAEKARQNTINYEIKVYQQTETKVLEIAETMSKSIEYHSRNGFDTLDFMPYEKTRFTSDQTMNIAQDILRKLFESNGFEILENDIAKNIFRIRW